MVVQVASSYDAAPQLEHAMHLYPSPVMESQDVPLRQVPAGHAVLKHACCALSPAAE